MGALIAPACYVGVDRLVFFHRAIRCVIRHDVSSAGCSGRSTVLLLFARLAAPPVTMQTMLSPPSDLTLKVRADWSLVVEWKHEHPKGVVFHIKVEYFDPSTPMIEPEETKTFDSSALVVHVLARLEPARSEACTVKVSVEAVGQDSPDVRSKAVTVQTTWDDQRTNEECQNDLQKRGEALAVQLNGFRRARWSDLHVLIAGAQHHGKSSFVNHVNRCLQGNLAVNDEMESAPAGSMENTQEILNMQWDGLCLMDTPAIPNMNDEMSEAFRSLLAGAISQGTRRRDFAKSRWALKKPPHAAILVMSLCHWRDQQDEMQSYLTAMARELKNASNKQVTFPFVVAATHRDEFLADSAALKPHEELTEVLNSMKKAANSEHVFAVTNYKKASVGSLTVNEQTFSLLSQLVTLAFRQDTGVVVARSQCLRCVSVTSFVWRSFDLLIRRHGIYTCLSFPTQPRNYIKYASAALLFGVIWAVLK